MRLDAQSVSDTLGEMAKPLALQGLRHVRPVEPVEFPSSDPEWDMPESLRHGQLCQLLYQILSRHLGPSSTVGKDNFVYFDASNRRRCLAPDAFVKLGVAQELFDSYRTWEKGTPELCAEVLSPSDTKEKLSLDEKLRRYHALGTRELVAFDVDAPEGQRLRAWDRIAQDLVERVVEAETTICATLGLQWVLAPGGPELPVALRLARPSGELLPTGEEAALAREQAALAGKEAERAEKEAERAAREEAEREVARLRNLLAQRDR